MLQISVFYAIADLHGFLLCSILFSSVMDELTTSLDAIYCLSFFLSIKMNFLLHIYDTSKFFIFMFFLFFLYGFEVIFISIYNTFL